MCPHTSLLFSSSKGKKKKKIIVIFFNSGKSFSPTSLSKFCKNIGEYLLHAIYLNIWDMAYIWKNKCLWAPIQIEKMSYLC